MSALAHDPRRRLLLSAGAGLLIPAAWAARVRTAGGPIEIAMSGTATGSETWFRPRGLLIQPGQAVRWVNKDQGNVHTSTAYHPDNGKPRRVPPDAKSWNSDYLLPGQSFVMVFDVPGVYDFFCMPHEHAGMVGRIVVGPVQASAPPYAGTDALLPGAAVAHFPTIADILAHSPIE